MKPSSTADDVRILSDISGDTKGFSAGFNSAGRIQIWNACESWQFVTTSSIASNVWTHLALVRNGTTITAFVNGQQELTITCSHQMTNIGLGANFILVHGTKYVGLLDEVRFWNTARTQSEIQLNRLRTIDASTSGLAAYYRFDEGNASGTNTGVSSLFDVSSNAKHGSLIAFGLSGSSSNWVSSDVFNTWTGATNTAWNNTGNWGRGSVPTSSENLYIPSSSEASNQPILDGSYTVGNLCNLGSIEIGSNSLTLNGSYLGTGTLKGSSSSNLTLSTHVGTLYFDQTILGTTNLIQHLVIGSGSNVSFTLGNALNIAPTGSVTFHASGSKTLTTTGQTFTLKSSASGTAYIGNTNGATITGNLSVERYLPATGRKFRFLSSPVVGATSSQWRNCGDNTAGMGIHITGTGSGFDASSTNSPSAFSYDEPNAGSGTGTTTDAGWTAFADGNNTALTNGKGYRVLVRGDRTLSLTAVPAPSANITTIKVTGTYPTSPVTINTTKTGVNANSGYNLVGNPYPSAIDWDAVSKTNVSATYYVYDPSSSSYVSWNGSIGNATRYIASSQAFFVLKTAASGSITVNESHKTTNAGGSLYKAPLENMLRVALKYDAGNRDELFVHFREDATEGQDNFDAPKLVNSAVNIATVGVDDKRYNINCLPTLETDREVAMSVLGSVASKYSLVFNDVSSFKSHDVYLVDNYLSTRTKVIDGFSYPVEITGDSATVKDGRFKLQFLNAATGNENLDITQGRVIVFPNPVLNVLNIDLNGHKNSSFIVFNQLGEKAAFGDFKESKCVLNTENFANGVYFLKISTDGGTQTIKFVK